jgi:hypothetical protein
MRGEIVMASDFDAPLDALFEDLDGENAAALGF